ncbi:MAG: PqqD family protein [Ruminococcaceae bacterium]|nr:PqqD family protein [Oscillospiraceae bacterium]
MKIREGFILKEIAGSYVVVPVGEDLVDFSLMITINETGAFLWNCLSEHKTEQQLVDCLKSEYEGASDEEFAADVAQFVSLLKENNILE